MDEEAYGVVLTEQELRALRAIHEKLRKAVPARRRGRWEEDVRLEGMAHSAFYYRAPLPSGVARGPEEGLKEHRTIEARHFSHSRGVTSRRKLVI